MFLSAPFKNIRHLKQMKKVIYSITKLGKSENTKVTGIGYITDEDLITANVSKTGKPYILCLTTLSCCLVQATKSDARKQNESSVIRIFIHLFICDLRKAFLFLFYCKGFL